MVSMLQPPIETLHKLLVTNRVNSKYSRCDLPKIR